MRKTSVDTAADFGVDALLPRGHTSFQVLLHVRLCKSTSWRIATAFRPQLDAGQLLDSMYGLMNTPYYQTCLGTLDRFFNIGKSTQKSYRPSPELGSSPRSFENPITTLVVGAEERKYHVHQGLLSSSSPYFAAAIKEEWVEGQKRRIPLLDDSAAAVDLYVQWLYGRRIFSRQSSEKLKDGQEELGVLIDGFVFGEKIQDGEFKDAVIDAITSSVSTIGKDDKYWYPSGEKADRVYKGTPAGSPLRRLLVDMHVHHGRRDSVVIT